MLWREKGSESSQATLYAYGKATGSQRTRRLAYDRQTTNQIRWFEKLGEGCGRRFAVK